MRRSNNDPTSSLLWTAIGVMLFVGAICLVILYMMVRP